MRVIAGVAKGFLLRTLEGYRTRPTSDRVRGALFNILGQRLPGVLFLDLFAGSGAVGIEALSRGAALCVFVDSSRAACAVIRRNLVATGFSEQAEVHCKMAAASLDIAARLGRVFDFIFVDPPYDKGMAAAVFDRIARKPVLRPGGTLVIEHSKRETLPAGKSSLTVIRSEVYGDTRLSFYRRTDSGSPGGEE